MSLWHEVITLDGTKIDPNITDAIPEAGAFLVGTMEGAASLELTVSDPEMRLLRSGALTRAGKAPTAQQELKQAAWDRFSALRLDFDGVAFRFAGVSLRYDTPPWTVQLTLESELATIMRLADEALKTSRGAGSRIEFVRRMFTEAYKHSPWRPHAFYGPATSGKDPIEKPDDADRNKGLSKSAKLTVKGVPMNSTQRKHATIALTEADRLQSGTRPTLSMLCAAIGESSIEPVANSKGSGYEGVFQANPKNIPREDTKQQAHYYMVGGKGFQQGGAIKLARDHQDFSSGEIAYRVEGDLSNFSSPAEAAQFYDQHQAEAEAILDAWGGAGEVVVERESFEFTAGEKDDNGKRENYWDGSGRLVEVRNWRRFTFMNGLYAGPDSFFFKNQPAFVVDGSKNLADQGVLGFTGDVDIGMPASELSLNVVAPRWTAGPGTVFEWANMGPLDGRWLIWSNRLDLTRQTEVAEIVLRRPSPEKKEPAPSVRRKVLNAGDDARALQDITIDPKLYGGSQSIIDQFVTPFMAQRGLKAGSAKRTPADNAAAGGAFESDHLTTSRNAYATDYPTRDGEDDARALAKELGFGDKWSPNDYTRFDVTTAGYKFSFQILWGAAIDHDDHVHVGVQVLEKGPLGPPAPGSGTNLWHPDAVRVKMADAGAFTGGGWKIVHHTTEGDSIAGAEGEYRKKRSAPHFTFDHDANVIHQHIPLNLAARSLKHPAGTKSTNTANAIQIEHVGFTADCGSWSSTDYDNIADLCRWIETAVGVPQTCSVSFLGPTIPRMSETEFVAYEGHCGHVHVPHNDHVDPTGFKIDDVL